jgi:hypothetical protein
MRMKSFAVGLTLGLLAPLSITIAQAATGDAPNTECWDQYDLTGVKKVGTVVPKEIARSQCTTGSGCYWGYDTAGRRNRLFVPYQVSPQKCLVTPTTTTTVAPTTVATTLPTTTAASTTVATTATTLPPAGSRFGLLPVGAALPSDTECAARVRRAPEVRPDNATANATKGTRANTTYPRVTGNFSGTTDEIIQWTACKWGIDEDWVRAQIVNESYWRQAALGDFTTTSTMCAPGFPLGNYPAQFGGDATHNGECPESIGLGQVRWYYHQSAFVDGNAAKSSAYNLDYTYAVWRECFEGRLTWLNTVERGATYAAGDARGCFGVWFSGRWYTEAANSYIQRFDATLAATTWAQPGFATTTTSGTTGTTATSTPTTIAASTTAAPTVAPATTQAPTTTATPTTTTLPPGTVPSGSAQFVQTFDGDTGMQTLERGVFHRNVGYQEVGEAPVIWGDGNALHGGSWTGDHDLTCGAPTTQRPLSSERSNFGVDQVFYNCRDHMMTSMGDTDGYSITWFSPNQVFNSVRSVSVDVNLTDLGTRQWIKVGVVSDALYNSTYGGAFPVGQVPGFLLSDVGSSNLDARLAGPDRLVASWSGGASAGYPGGLKIGNTKMGGSYTAGTDKATRHPVTLTDNGNGTITWTVGPQSATATGRFPACPCRVVFYDHDYTPEKSESGYPVGFTFHWDNIVVR